jgi:peptide methionine sulfoxide reductase MsrA
LEKTYYNKVDMYIMIERKDHSNTHTKKLQTTTFAATCFWRVEEAFCQVKDVKSTYKNVYTDKTGHAEPVQLKFDPNEVSYEELLDVFWSIHYPTAQNRQVQI